MNYAIVFAQSWKFGFNDSSLIAWVIVFAYFAAAFYCCRANGKTIVTENQGTRSPWIVLALFLGFLGVNKQLDLHKAVLNLGRGLYAEQSGQNVSLLIVGGIAASIGVILTLWLIARMLRVSNHQQRWAWGVLFVLCVAHLLRFLPGLPSRLLLAHVFTAEEGLLHIHILETLELASLTAIVVLARDSVSDRDVTPI